MLAPLDNKMTKELAKIQSAFWDAFQRVGKRALPEVLDRVFSGDDELGLTPEPIHFSDKIVQMSLPGKNGGRYPVNVKIVFG